MGTTPRLAFVRGVRDLLISTDDDDGGPVELVGDFAQLEADFRVAPHPIDLLSERREAVETVGVRVEVAEDRNDVRLIVSRARKSAQARARQYFPALRSAELMHNHRERQSTSRAFLRSLRRTYVVGDSSSA